MRGCIFQSGFFAFVVSVSVGAGLGAGLSAVHAASEAPAQEPDEFSSRLERSAQLALARGEAAEAARKLRLACFGMLGLPPRLAACLVRLGVAEARAGDRDSFLATFERLDEAEQRFSAYAAAPLEPEERAEFETRVAEWIEPGMLVGRPAFAVIAARRAFVEAEKQLDDGEVQAAIDSLEGVPAEIDEGRAWCLRGEAYARADRCEAATSAFAACRPERRARSAAAALGCLTTLRRFDEARRLAAALPAAVREERAVQRRLTELRKAGDGGAPPATP